MENSSGLSMENDSGELQMENYSNSRLMGFKWRTLMVGGELQVENYSGRVELENNSGLRTENDSGEL